MEAASVRSFRGRDWDDGRDGYGGQLLEGQAQGHRLHVCQVMHHQLASLSEHNDGDRVVVLCDGALGRDQRKALDGPEPGQGVDVITLPAVCLQQEHRTWLRH